MKLSEESKKRIIEAYIGDLHWLKTIEQEVAKYDSEDKDKIFELLGALTAMNNVVIDTETLGSLEKYYDKAHELYSEMKIELTEMLGIEDMWEEI